MGSSILNLIFGARVNFQAHATFVCGKNGGGAAEMFDCEKDIDICVGTLSKAAACQGGFIACRYIFFMSSSPLIR